MARSATATGIRLLLLAAIGMTAASVTIFSVRFAGPGLLFIAGFAGLLLRRGGRSLYAHGTAREADFNDLFRHGMIGVDHGPVLGRAAYLPRPGKLDAVMGLLSPGLPSKWAVYLFFTAFGTRWRQRRALIRVPNFVHLVTFAPTGAGKSVSVLIPNLLSYVSSCVVLDPKGELHNATAGHRERKFASKTVRLDPYGICGPGGAAFNPLGFLTPSSPSFLDDCRDIANMLIVRTGKETEPHWNDMSEMVLTCVIAFVVVQLRRDEHHLQSVRDIVSNPKTFANMIEVMANIPQLARLGNQLRWLKEREQASVMSTLQRQLSWLDGEVMKRHTTGDGFDPLSLRDGTVSLYLILPTDRLATLAPLLRLWVGFTLRRATRGGANERNPLLFLIDEAGHLGHIQALEDAVTLMRGYGIRLWFFFQSMGQLSKAFGDRASVFLDNIDTQQYFCINAIDSADVISRMIGDETITIESHQRGSSTSRPSGMSDKGQGSQYSASSSVTVSQMGRRLYKPEEILRLPSDMALIFHRNLPVIPARLIVSYRDRDFRNGGGGERFRLGFGSGLTAVAAVIFSFFGLGYVTALSPRSFSDGVDMSAEEQSAPPRRRRKIYYPRPSPYEPSGVNPWLPETW